MTPVPAAAAPPSVVTARLLIVVVADLGLPLNRLEQQRRRVEELFRDHDDEEARGDD